MTTATCAATKQSPTAAGQVETRCGKKAGRVAAGDPDHEGWQGVFPIRWRATAT